MKFQLSLLKISLYPFSMLYGIGTGVRNWLFDKKILPITAFSIPIISVGNLSVGGTGKTPHTEYILRLLQQDIKVALLSRGYKRQTKGFFIANENSDAITLGDEPFQIYRKFTTITVAVDEKRVHGVQELLKFEPDIEGVVLDDAFQHRYIKPGLSILLTDFNHLYTRDHLLPAGRLREFKSGNSRANIIVVTKCPDDISEIEFNRVEAELKPAAQQTLYFSKYIYSELAPVFPTVENEHWTYNRIINKDVTVLLVAGIVNPQTIVEHLRKFSHRIETIFYKDHHAFLIQDLVEVLKRFENIKTANKIVLVTEKDAARLVNHQFYPEKLKPITYAIPIEVKILRNQEKLFNQKIQDYVTKNTRNSELSTIKNDLKS